MSENPTNSGKMATVCFFTIFCGTAFGMGFFILEMMASTSFGPPIFMVFVPFGMGIFGMLMCITTLKRYSTTSSLKPGISSYGSGSTVYTGDYTVRSDTHHRQKSVYRVPPICPLCGADISTETVDWVGPLQAKCPYCGGTVEAEERVL
ncbi:MAG: hypothetical protein RTV72_00830 [Candidatus Thorarchaeota archaeon]